MMVAGLYTWVCCHNWGENTRKSYEKCGGYADEALSAIRTVYAFCAETLEKNKYFGELAKAQAAGIKSAGLSWICNGTINCSLDFIFGFAFMIGSFFIQNHVKNGLGIVYILVDCITVFMAAILNGLMSFSFITPQFENISEARIAAYKIYEVIESIPVTQPGRREEEE